MKEKKGSEKKSLSKKKILTGWVILWYLWSTRVSAIIYCLMKCGTIMAQYTLKICHYDFVSADLVH